MSDVPNLFFSEGRPRKSDENLKKVRLIWAFGILIVEFWCDKTCDNVIKIFFAVYVGFALSCKCYLEQHRYSESMLQVFVILKEYWILHDLVVACVHFKTPQSHTHAQQRSTSGMDKK